MTAQLERSLGRLEGKLDSLIDLVKGQAARQDDHEAADLERERSNDKRFGKIERKQTWISAVIGTVAALFGGSAEHMLRVAFLAGALALMAAPAAAKPTASNPADEARRVALLRALHTIGIEVGAVWPIGDAVYQVEAIDIEQPRPGETVITVRTRLLSR